MSEISGVALALCVGLIAISIVAFSIAWIGNSYFNAVSRNPTINDSVRPMLLIFISCAEFASLIITVVSIMMMMRI